MEWLYILRWLHILGATVLLGTGAGIAFFMVMAHRSGNVTIIAHTAGAVVVADWLFTAMAVVAQTVSGWLLADALGLRLTESWIAASLGLYIVTGIFWLPVVWIQLKLRDIAKDSLLKGTALPARYFRFYRVWFACGFPAFVAVLIIVWLMVARPSLW